MRMKLGAGVSRQLLGEAEAGGSLEPRRSRLDTQHSETHPQKMNKIEWKLLGSMMSEKSKEESAFEEELCQIPPVQEQPRDKYLHY